jgi:hypothetical protein
MRAANATASQKKRSFDASTSWFAKKIAQRTDVNAHPCARFFENTRICKCKP